MGDQTLAGILTSAAAAFPSRPALSVPGRLSLSLTLTHSQLLHLIYSAATHLATAGVCPGDVVALAFPNSLDFVIVFLVVIRARAVAAPLNPAYTEDEFNFYLSDSEAMLLLTNPEGNPASQATATKLHLRHTTVSLVNNEMFFSLLVSELGLELATVTPNISSDVALFLHSSGTTRRPKGVPLTQLNLAASVNKSAYQLSSTDSTIIVLPLFHVHGLIAGLLSPLAVGADVRALFTSSSAVTLERAASARENTLLSPIWIHSRTSGKPFYTILHRTDVGIIVDLEPARIEDPDLSIAGVVQSEKLAVRVISHLQALPGGDIKLLCDTVVTHVRELTGYDRVMVYKFHKDEHDEVVAESKRDDLEPYIGLHYPATDILQASRFLFKQNCVRMIADCQATPVRMIQNDNLMKPLCLIGSALRAPHECQAQYMMNMGTKASLALAVIINGSDEGSMNSMKLWGLVVCHHTLPRCIPFPLRYACEFLMQAFGLQLNMELPLASQLLEKHILRNETLLCDMLLRDSPTRITTQSPSIMDLVKCNGTTLYYQGKYYPLGVTPTEAQIRDIGDWLCASHRDSTGLSTDSLADAGYPNDASLGDAVYGMALAYLSPKDFIFWFRSHTAKEIQWGGAKHVILTHPWYTEIKDDGQRMHPRLSFQAFLEVVKSRSLSLEVDIDSVVALADENTVAMVIISHSNPCENVFTYHHLAKIAETANIVEAEADKLADE